MKKLLRSPMRPARAAIAAATIMAVAIGGAVLGSRGGLTPATKSTARASGAHATRSDSGSDGITVHGRWTINVLNPDGTVASANRFENALVTSGAGTLADILSRSKSGGLWQVELWGPGPPPNFPCTTSGGTPGDAPCFLVEPSSLASGANEVFKTLTVTASGGTLVLAGTATAQHDSTIVKVNTNFGSCSPGTAPSACTLEGTSFTSKTGLSIPVKSDQSIAVRIEISFS